MDIQASRINPGVLVHTDGAPAYRTVVDGVNHDYVNHSMCCASGPEYTKRAHRKTAAGKPYVAQAGTQALDGWWGATKKNAFGVPAKHPAALHERVRETQWHHWVGDGDRWVAAGEVLSWVPE